MKKLYNLLAIVSLLFSANSFAASKVELDAKSDAAVKTFYKTVPAGRELAGKAKAMLVFPTVIKGGLGIGAEYGEGILYVGNIKQGYYRTVSASVGFQAGGQVKTQVILFMTNEALNKFKSSKGWKAGVDGSVAIATLGAGGAIDTNTLNSPVIGFILGNKGLMYNATIEGSKISKIKKK